MLRYILIGLLLAGCSTSDGAILAKDFTDTGEVVLTTAKGGTFIVERTATYVAIGEEASYSNGYIHIGGKAYSARRDR